MKKYNILHSVPISMVMSACVDWTTPTEISKRINKSIQTVSDQLTVLHKEEYVDKVKDGRSRKYKLRKTAIMVHLPKGYGHFIDKFILSYMKNQAYSSFTLNQLINLFKLDMESGFRRVSYGSNHKEKSER